MGFTFKQLKRLIKEEVESSIQNPHNLKVGDEVTLKYFAYAYPSMPTRQQMVRGDGTMIPAGTSVLIVKIQGEYAIINVKSGGNRLVTAVKLQNLKPDDFYSIPK